MILMLPQPWNYFIQSRGHDRWFFSCVWPDYFRARPQDQSETPGSKTQITSYSACICRNWGRRTDYNPRKFWRKIQKLEKFQKTIYSFIKAKKILEPNLLRELDARLRKVEKYLEEPTSVILKRFPKKTKFQDCGIDLSYSAVERLEAKTISLLAWWWFR